MVEDPGDEPTLAELAALTAGQDYWHTRPVPRLGIPSMLFCDGPHGLRKQRDSRGFAATAVPATCFPTASALAASWDLALVAEIGTALGREARSEGVSVLLGPGANIKRTALCGRNFEYFSEDPYLSSRLAAAWITAVQSTGVGASLKHFAANNQEHRRYTVDALVDERALREIYLASFEFAVVAARPATVMTAYNRLNGAYCAASVELLTRVLREEWGFDGAVISDWGATPDRASAIGAGLDLEMPGFAGRGDDEVLASVHSGTVDRPALVRAGTNVRRLAERTAAARQPGWAYSRDDHHALARRAAAAGMVLLRNDGLLPLAPTGSIAILGAFAREPRYQGAGSSEVTPHRVDNLWDELATRTDPARLSYAEGYPETGAVDAIRLGQARAVARAADVAVVVVGLPDSYETEGLDRSHLDLPEGHDALVRAVAEVNPRTIVVLANGAPVLLPWADRVGAIVEAYLGGQAGGSALAEVLLGLAFPGGRLAETFPVALADNPVHTGPTGPTTVEYREGVYVGYRYYDHAGTAVAFPFGYGLSYTTFAWSPVEAVVADGVTTVSVEVTNTGGRAGSEVVQVYLHDEESTVYRPVQELKGFAKLHLAPGATGRATVTLDRRAFAVWDPASHGWVVEGGRFELRVGASSRDIRGTAWIELPGDGVVLTPSRFDPAGFAERYGRPVPANVVPQRGHYTMDTALGDLRQPVARLFLATLVRVARAVLRSTPDTAMSKIVDRLLSDAPVRMLPMITQGRIGTRAARRLLAVANGRPLGRTAARAAGAADRNHPGPTPADH